MVVALVKCYLLADSDEENVIHADRSGPLLESDKLDINVAVEVRNDVHVVADEVG